MGHHRNRPRHTRIGTTSDQYYDHERQTTSMVTCSCQLQSSPRQSSEEYKKYRSELTINDRKNLFNIQQCQEMYARLQLDKPRDNFNNQESPFPLLRGQTMIAQPRPLTYTKRQSTAHAPIRPFSIRSAPAFMFKNEQDAVDEEQENRLVVDNMSESDYDYDERGVGRKRSKMDSDQLCKHLEGRGLGLPMLVKSTPTYRRVSQTIPRAVRNRALSRNPSNREKIKGRARLDQEMANMKALAFCEQQAPKVFRSASANMRNRDVQLMEEEMRDHMHREGIDGDDMIGDDDNASIVVMPIKQEELFLRINTWITEVESECKSYNNLQYKSTEVM